ncbi:PAS/PAC sensor signal transduction histidine kinase [Desulfofarcimen acetoxidans DSM 771]|jgi:two-component system sensor histidine kinase AtoS|uniref:histidine kinase n=1 Tax=Desulfofarcimen acetoxidans (strain ATCC 49208 / DSM 771 / KCTC 5769 / VKM B-1644 / 5575) TaxID=485916 RepID=C8W3D1_DESAS|nr:two-component system sensor histidine kinase AtoS [Desulfofarcimen acetoxidans]ACV61898.1 PAS/PAC sensor signal transduction histidine kinase [Desulfofarcimen acetoxidans DSM 771]
MRKLILKKLNNVSFGNRILFFVLLLLVIPVLLIGYMLHISKNSEMALLENQKKTLNMAAYRIEQEIPGSLSSYLESQGAAKLSREEQRIILGKMVNGVIGSVHRDYPNVHMGIYCKELDVFYDGTERLNENYSLRRKKAFDETLEKQQDVFQNVGSEEGGIVEIYKPFVRDNRVEGVIRIADYLSEVGYYTKRREVETIVYAVILTLIVTGIGGSMLLFRQFVDQVHHIRDGVNLLENNLSKTLTAAPGELGEIVNAVNRFAKKISDLNLYNQTMLLSINDAILVVDAAGKLIIASNMAKEIFNLPPDFFYKHYAEVLPVDPPFADYMRRTLEDNWYSKDLLVVWHTEAKELLQLLLSASPLLDAQDNIIGAVLTVHDITERVKLRERVHRQERLAALGKLVAGVAHEIRNPLTSISCYIQHWQDQNIPSPKALSTMFREVTRLDTIVDQLLYFAKPAEAKFIKKDINFLIEDVLGFFQEVYKDKCNFVRNYQSNLPLVWIDPEQIERVLANMFFNAMQAIQEEITVTVSTEYCAAKDKVYVSVSDTGCGIPPENLAQLFDPFFSTRPKGTGLGLAIAHEIIQAHGGHIEVESEVGRGAKFSFYLKTKEED